MRLRRLVLLSLLSASALAATPPKPIAPPVERVIPAGGPTLKGVACAARPDCRIVRVHPAGAAADGSVLAVAEVRPGPGADAAPCADDAVRTWWLLEDGRPVRRLLATCTTSGATVTVEADALTLTDGPVTRRFGLRPPRLLLDERCERADGIAQRLRQEPAQGLARVWVAQAAAPAAPDCPPARADWNAEPAPGVLAALALPRVKLTEPVTGTLDACALALGDGAVPGLGAPPAAGAPPQLRALVLAPATLLLDLPAAPAQVEVWLSPAGRAVRPAARALHVYRVDGDGTLDASPRGAPRARLVRRDGHDAAGRARVLLTLRWAGVDLARSGLAVAVAVTAAGARTATTGFARGLPLLLPTPVAPAAACRVVDGRLQEQPFDPFAP
ncbi:hypothetical protein EV699_11760 [Plasticicumulans lactativorans]|uniref:Uncharacterized protein n=1 Tax=Plasticicumulans lactativorans TaxID=1133106 RepID=A0A4R2KYK8_9GAMM|nr:hypothetical protein [Plasticicumulans lactativorans]TCO79751.1 hypothetical protein EV699_11760 [Plasticicumulans lactativorans]